MKNSKKWCCCTIVIMIVLTVLMGGLTAVIDPFFHYHAPLQGMTYPITEQRYQNDGIVKHFTYDAIITGTSMTENFLASEMDALFGVKSIKVPFSGATFKEIDENLKRAIRANPDISTVVRSLDGYMLFSHKEDMRQDVEYPEYLYDASLLNDVSYLFNVEILLNHTVRVLQYTLAGQPTTSFDEYSYWADRYPFGPEPLLKNYTVPDAVPESVPMDAETIRTVRENVLQNVVSTAQDNPEIEFFYYFPPYSIVWWCVQQYDGNLERQIDAYKLATEEILKCKNIHLFSFVGAYEITTDLYNYMDKEHHTAQINSKILADMRSGNYMLTRENYEEYWETVKEFYAGFDYVKHFESYGF